MSAPRDAFADYRSRLEAMGFRPSSARGQNFLLDPTLHRVIADAAAAGPGDVLLEIGVGLGFLTRELADRGARVLGVEIDERLFAVARDELRSMPNVELVLGDALGGDGGDAGDLHPEVMARLHALLPTAPRFVVAANLPYAASGPLLAALACLPRQPDRIVVLVQKELGLRLAAAPGTADYGGLSAQLQVQYDVEYLRTVGAEVFRPRPKVASAIVCLQRRAAPPLTVVADRRAFQTFVRALFGKRRKVLRTTLAEAAAALSLPVPAGLSAELLARRAETLAPTELVALFAAVRPVEESSRLS